MTECKLYTDSSLIMLSINLEKAVYSQPECHLSLNKLHGPQQSAYRKFHSTETALMEVQHDIKQSLNKTNVAIFIQLDLSAAFDTIDHKTLESSTIRV